MIRVLLAEDDTAHQFLLRSALKKANPEVELTVVGNGEDLIRTIRAAGPTDFDCLVLDFNLPDYRANELMEELADAIQDIPAIAISSSNEQRVAIESMRSGTVDFLPKEEALQNGNLWQSIQRAIESSRRRDAERRHIQRRMQHLTRLAATDPLTGLFNRLAVNDLLHDRRKMVDRRGPYSCLMLDLDHFKKINDTHGHLAGDEVLRAAGNALRTGAGAEDIACRWGGEEFLMIMPCTPAAAAMARAEAIRKNIAMSKIGIGSGQTVTVTASIGVATAHTNQAFGEQTIVQADEALYLAKERGRNQVCSWQMVVLNKLIDAIESEGGSPQDRLSALLNKAGDVIGPVQREHVSAHSEQVCELASRLGTRLGMTAKEIDQVRTAGLFHDVGKLLIPEEILTKPGPLSEEERQLVDIHPSTGAEIGKRLGVDPQAAELIRQHHDRFDSHNGVNSQYQAPMGARIIALADAFVTMTSQRPYRAAKSVPEAISELRRERGGQFDPQVVDAASEALA